MGRQNERYRIRKPDAPARDVVGRLCFVLAQSGTRVFLHCHPSPLPCRESLVGAGGVGFSAALGGSSCHRSESRFVAAGASGVRISSRLVRIPLRLRLRYRPCCRALHGAPEQLRDAIRAAHCRCAHRAAGHCEWARRRVAAAAVDFSKVEVAVEHRRRRFRADFGSRCEPPAVCRSFRRESVPGLETDSASTD